MFCLKRRRHSMADLIRSEVLTYPAGEIKESFISVVFSDVYVTAGIAESTAWPAPLMTVLHI